MERFHRYYSLHRILSSRRLPVPRATIERELECSRATVNRVIDDLRGYGAPIEYLREQNGYRYTPGVAFELPGICVTVFPAHAGMNRIDSLFRLIQCIVRAPRSNSRCMNSSCICP